MFLQCCYEVIQSTKYHIVHSLMRNLSEIGVILTQKCDCDRQYAFQHHKIELVTEVTWLTRRQARPSHRAIQH